MASRTTIAALAFAATVSTALADPNRAPPIEARVAAAGHVTSANSPPAGPERIDSATPPPLCSASPEIAPDEARALVQKIAERENFYPDFVLAVARQESGFHSAARSDKGAFGLMQLTPQTAARFKVDLCDPAGNVLGGVRYLRALHEKYRNPFFMLAAYNAGEGAVEKSRGVPPFPETVRFVAAVINYFYAWPAPGPQGHDNSRGHAPNLTAASDLIEAPASAQFSAPSAPVSLAPAPAGKVGWDGGFVMHLD